MNVKMFVLEYLILNFFPPHFGSRKKIKFHKIWNALGENEASEMKSYLCNVENGNEYDGYEFDATFNCLGYFFNSLFGM